MEIRKHATLLSRNGTKLSEAELPSDGRRAHKVLSGLIGSLDLNNYIRIELREAPNVVEPASTPETVTQKEVEMVTASSM